MISVCGEISGAHQTKAITWSLAHPNLPSSSAGTVIHCVMQHALSHTWYTDRSSHKQIMLKYTSHDWCGFHLWDSSLWVRNKFQVDGASSEYTPQLSCNMSIVAYHICGNAPFILHQGVGYGTGLQIKRFWKITNDLPNFQIYVGTARVLRYEYICTVAKDDSTVKLVCEGHSCFCCAYKCESTAASLPLMAGKQQWHWADWRW